MSDIPEANRRKVADRDGGCVVCGASPFDIHHRQRRREGGHDLSNLVALCRRHHAEAHANPAVARSWGLIVPTWGHPSRTPYWSALRGAWLLLDDLGSLPEVVTP